MFLKYPLVFLGIWVFMTGDAHAYLDPGTGSYFVQIVIASLAGAGYLLVTSWDRVKKFLGDISSRFKGKKRNAGGK